MQPDTRALLDTLAKSIGTPIEEARGLPPLAYTSEEFYELEVEHLFRRDWICIGREEEAANPGDFFTMELAGEPLLLDFVAATETMEASQRPVVKSL